MHLKPLPKFLILAAIVGGGLAGYRHLVYTGTIRRPSILKTVIPIKADDINATVLASTTVPMKPLPSSTVMPPCTDGNTSNCINGAVQEIEIWAWNSNMGLLYATGGAQTTRGSLAAAHNVSISIKREDDTNNMQRDLLDCAQKLTSDPNASCTKFVTVMGDGLAQMVAAVNPKLVKVCSTCTLKVAGVLGYSRGEDGFWGPQAWKLEPQKARGGVVVGVLRDGDWNIAEKWAGQNGIPNNPDDSVYDPNALNWINSDSYTKAANDFATNTACEDVPVKGKLTGSKAHKCADAVVTWTPGDVTVARKRGGVVPIASTQQYVFQMPAVLVGIDMWMKTHSSDVGQILAASFEGADQIRANPAALDKAGQISAAVYKEENADYWVKYFKGATESDAQGIRVHLGGSSVANLADNLQAFGLKGGPSLFAATYKTFGDIVVQQYPRLVPSYPPASQIVDTSYITAIRGTLPENNGEEVIKTNTTAPMRSIAGRKNYSIQFSSSSADILPTSFADLDQLARDISITNYIAALHGYTDNAKWAGDINGTSYDRNLKLSQDRANAVREYLVSRGVRNTLRVYGHGSDDPIADNGSSGGRAMNRRVTVVLGE